MTPYWNRRGIRTEREAWAWLANDREQKSLNDMDDEIEHARSTWPSCSGPCDQGRKLCVTPWACEVSETTEAPFSLGWWLAERVALVVAVGIILALFWGVL